MVEGIQDGWRNTGWLKENRMIGGIQDGWRNTGWLEEYRILMKFCTHRMV